MREPSPGTLHLVRGDPNPNGAGDADLYLLVGDPTIGSIHQIMPEEGLIWPEPRADLQDNRFRLYVAHFNDLHGRISHLTPHAVQPVFSRMVGHWRELRRRCENDTHAALLVLSAGDDMTGSLFDELLGNGSDSYVVHAGYRLYSAAGVDVGVLGNHDFDKGTRPLARALRFDARFPLLSANLIGSERLAGLYYPAAILVIKGVRVGIIGLTTSAEIRPRDDAELHIANPIQVARNLVPVLRPLCDVLIVLSHLGHSQAAQTATVEGGGDLELAQSLPYAGAHLIVGGHTHQPLNEGGLCPSHIVNGIPIVQAGALGRSVGEVSITLRGSDVAVTSARVTPTADLPADQDFERQWVAPLVELVRPLATWKLGRVADHPDLSTEAIRNDFAAGESALTNFVADALMARCRDHGYDVDLAMIDASSMRCGLPVGDELAFGDWFNLMPFADKVRLYHITGYALKALLVDNALRADRPGEPHTERGFAQFSQEMRYTLELGSDRAGAQAQHISVDGVPLDDRLERTFLVACNSFFREAALAWEQHAVQELNLPILNVRDWPCFDTNFLLRDEIIAYIRAHGGVTEAAGARRDGRLRCRAWGAGYRDAGHGDARSTDARACLWLRVDG